MLGRLTRGFAGCMAAWAGAAPFVYSYSQSDDRNSIGAGILEHHRYVHIIYTYIYIYRERERYTSIYRYIYTYTQPVYILVCARTINVSVHVYAYAYWMCICLCMCICIGLRVCVYRSKRFTFDYASRMGVSDFAPIPDPKNEPRFSEASTLLIDRTSTR